MKKSYILRAGTLFVIVASCMGQTTSPGNDWPAVAKEMQHVREHPPATPEEKAHADLLQMQLARMLIEANKANFDVKGDVSDEDGKPLEKVTMTIERYNAPHMGPGLSEISGGGERVQSIINGPFEASGKGWWGMEVKFSKEGYLPESLSFSAETNANQINELLANGVISPSTVTKNGLHVELFKRPMNSLTLNFGGTDARILSDGSGQYVQFAPDQSHNLPVIKYADSKDIQKLPADAFILEAAVDPESKKFAATMPVKGYNFPTHVTLRLNAKDGGIIIVEPKRHWDFLLREAPEKGYQQEVTLSGAELYNYHFVPGLSGLPGGAGPKGTFFYFKTSDGKYGKGNISGGVDDSGKIIEYHIGIGIQTDGTRDVQTDGT